MTNRKICRLCLNDDSQCIELFTEYGKDMNIVDIISQHFWFQPLEDDNFSNLICCACWTNLKNFHEFYGTVKSAQEKLLTNKSDDYKYVKLEPIIKVEVDSYFNNGSGNDTDSEGLTTNDSKNQLSRKCKLKNTKTKNISKKKKLSSEKQNIDSLKSNIGEDKLCNIVQKKRGRKPKLKPNETEKADKKPNNQNQKKIVDKIKREKEDRDIKEFFQLQCQLCSTKWESYAEVKPHYRKMHGIQRGYVLCCNRKLFRRCEILEHLEWHLNPDNFRCNLCNKVYTEKYTLKIHMLQHAPDDVKKYECNTCGKRYATKCKIRHHLNISHVSAHRLVHKCDQCGKAFAIRSLLHNHIQRIHEAAYTTVCDICAKVFKSKAQCNIHREAEHSEQKPEKLQCHICNVWLKASSFYCHMRRSHEEAPQTCNVCGKISPNKNALQGHMRFVHQTKRLHKCNLCDKAFKQAISLREHMASHTGGVLYVCSYCPKTFNSNANMHAHRKKVHPVEWLKDRNKRFGPDHV